MVRIPRSHRGGRGSIPRLGIPFFLPILKKYISFNNNNCYSGHFHHSICRRRHVEDLLSNNISSYRLCMCVHYFFITFLFNLSKRRKPTIIWLCIFIKFNSLKKKVRLLAGSNHRPLVYKTSALATELKSRLLPDDLDWDYVLTFLSTISKYININN